MLSNRHHALSSRRGMLRALSILQQIRVMRWQSTPSIKRMERDVIRFRSLVLGMGLCGISQLVGCTQSPHAAVVADAAPERITIRSDTNVCIMARIDPRIWPSLVEEGNASLGGIMASQLRRLFEDSGGAKPLPGARNEPRFANNRLGTNPLCQDIGTDIFITAEYLSRDDGTPFIFRYRVQQGEIVRTGTGSRDLLAEIRSGEVPSSSITEPIKPAIANDIRRRAEEIFHLMDF